MRVEIVEETGGQADVPSFPPRENYVDLRQNPQAIERIVHAREYLPLRNFLIAVNSPESVFASATVNTECAPTGPDAPGQFHEFRSRTSLVFAMPALNFDRTNYTELTARLKELLERDAAESTQGVLLVSACDFVEQSRRGFYLGIQLAARGDSPRQAELRWGLGLARVQQALLFSARALGEQIGA